MQPKRPTNEATKVSKKKLDFVSFFILLRPSLVELFFVFVYDFSQECMEGWIEEEPRLTFGLAAARTHTGCPRPGPWRRLKELPAVAAAAPA